MCDLDVTGAPSIFKRIRSAPALARIFPVLDLSCEENNKEVHKTVLMTTECVGNYIRTKPGGVKDTTLTHHTFFTTKLIPKFDKFIDGKNMGKMRVMTRDLVPTVFSHGWTDVNHHPIVNIIMDVRSLHTLRASIDTMGEEKTMDFIAALIVEHIKEIDLPSRCASRCWNPPSRSCVTVTVSGGVP